ncbi:TRI25 ligase, partial [Polypterus senegalus]
MMAEAELFGLQDEVICCICLDTLSDPVTILCGHSFCLRCLTEYWDQNQDCRCPQCRIYFTRRPKLHRNTALNGVIRKIKKPRLGPHPFENFKNMECDACIGSMSRPVKFCLTCMASFCQTHLKPHLEIAALKDHKLTDADGNLKDQFCAQHKKRLEMFCINDNKCVCVVCVATGHNEHIMVELEMERTEKQKQFGVTMNEIRRRLEEREKIMKKSKRAVEQMKISVPNAVDEHKKSFTDLICCIDETQRKLTQRIREQVTREVEKAEGVIEKQKKDMEEQKKRC